MELFANVAGPEIAERLLIYHAGTGRTTFLAMLKVTTLFVGAFFCFIAVPSYIKAEKSVEETAKGKGTRSFTPLTPPSLTHHGELTRKKINANLESPQWPCAALSRFSSSPTLHPPL